MLAEDEPFLEDLPAGVGVGVAAAATVEDLVEDFAEDLAVLAGVGAADFPCLEEFAVVAVPLAPAAGAVEILTDGSAWVVAVVVVAVFLVLALGAGVAVLTTTVTPVAAGWEDFLPDSGDGAGVVVTRKVNLTGVGAGVAALVITTLAAGAGVDAGAGAVGCDPGEMGGSLVKMAVAAACDGPKTGVSTWGPASTGGATGG